MSSILDALKKLEREQAARRTGTLDIGAEILKNRESCRRRWKLGRFGICFWLGAVLLFGLLAGGGLFWGRLFSPVVSGPDVANRPSSTAALPHPAASVPIASTPAFDPSPNSAVGPSRIPEGKPSETRKSGIADSTFHPASASKSSTASIPNPRNLPLPKKSGPAPDSNTFAPALTLIGIAFQAGQGNALAIINNQPLMEGETILGARVEKILSDRVRLSWRGRSIELRLENSFR
ncbi:MAG: hypothetical protein JXB25_02365 [Deltaproteobacteria bacterium]|nr:hypothetical protein [Deltaproteobacteria bacterium]